MGYYTPDWIHIRSEWDFLVPPLAAWAGTVILGVLFFVYPRRFPKDIGLRVALMLAAVLITVALSFSGLARCFWSIHAVDFVGQGKGNAELFENGERLTGLSLPPGTTFPVAVMFGWREYTSWYGMRTDTAELAQAARVAGYQEISPAHDENDPPPCPELLTSWASEKGFTPTLILRKQDPPEKRVTLMIDTVRGLAVAEVIDG